MNSVKMGMSKFVAAQSMKLLRSVLLMAPIGLTSAELPRDEVSLEITVPKGETTYSRTLSNLWSELARAFRRYLVGLTATQAFINVRATQHKQGTSTGTFANFTHDLCHGVSKDHAASCLDVLQKKI